MGLWRCPKCGREFKRNNQSHYCGSAPKSVEEYIAAQPEALKPMLAELSAVIREALPQAQERISWSMPTWRGKENILHFAVSSRHINLYVGKDAVQFFAEQLKGIESEGGAIRLDPQKPLPNELIGSIARWCAQEQLLRNLSDGI